MRMDAKIHAEVCHALPDRQILIGVELPAGATLRQAIDASGILDILKKYPDSNLDLATQKVGVFGKIRSLDAMLTDDDRVEIYRPLTVDPKTARQRRVDKIRRAGSVEGRKWLPKDSR